MSQKQFVQVNDCRSTQHSLERGVPQGSVLGLLLYLLYTSPIADTIKLHKLHHYLYADDTQLYISLKLTVATIFHWLSIVLNTV